MRNRLIHIVITLTILLACFSGAEAKQPSWSNQELLDITRVMEQSNMEIKKWAMYGKTTAGFVSDFTGYVQVIESLQAKSPIFTWEKAVESNKHWKVSGFYRHKSGITEQVSVFAYPQKKQYMTYIIYEVKGQTWDTKTRDQLNRIYRDKVYLFLGNSPSIYACAQGVLSDNINIVLQKRATQLVQSFDATIVESITEETFMSLSAYTDKWKHSIQTDQQQMNLQIGIRNNGIGAKTTITIGTPIITIEY